MKRIFVLLLCAASCLACKKDKSASGGTTDTPNVRDVQPAKNYYASLGAQFQFRAAYEMGMAADGKTGNQTSLDVYSILESGGKVSVFFNTSIPALSMQNAGALVNCKGDYLSSTTSGGLGFNIGYGQKAEADVLPDNDLMMYVYTDVYRGSTTAPYGNIGNQGGYCHNVTKNILQNAVTPNGSWGYMYMLNNQVYYFSVWGTSYPALHTYNATANTWSNQKVTAMDGTYKNFLVSQDVAKVGNTDKVYWAYLSFQNDFTIDGQVNILSCDGTSFSSPKSLTIGSIGQGSAGNGIYKHSVVLCKNGTNPEQPYIVVRRYNTNILDIYKFNGASIEIIKQGVNIPLVIPVTNGTLRRYNKIAGVNGNLFMFATDGGNRLFKLNGAQFEQVYTNLIRENENFTAIETSSKGLLVSISKTIPTQPKQTMVSDIVLIPN